MAIRVPSTFDFSITSKRPWALYKPDSFRICQDCAFPLHPVLIAEISMYNFLNNSGLLVHFSLFPLSSPLLSHKTSFHKITMLQNNIPPSYLSYCIIACPGWPKNYLHTLGLRQLAMRLIRQLKYSYHHKVAN